MSQIAQCKFSQNKRLGAELLKSSPALLIEATFDTFWGAGLPVNSKDLINGNWRGRNNMGQILVNCRTELNRELTAGRWSSPHLGTQLVGDQNFQRQTPYGSFPAVNQTYQRPVPTGQPIYGTQPATEIKQSSQSFQQLPQSQMQVFPNVSMPPPTYQSYPQQGHSNLNFSQQVHPVMYSSQSYQDSQQNQPAFGSQVTCGFSPAPSSAPSLSYGDRIMGYDPNMSPVYSS